MHSHAEHGNEVTSNKKDNTMAKIYLIRHGQASFGQHDYDCLSPTGERQARLTGEWLSGSLSKNFSVLGCGTLLRQKQTLSGIVAGMSFSAGDPARAESLVLPDLNELSTDDLILTASSEYSDRASLDKAISRMENPAHTFFNLYRSALDRWTSGKYDDEYQESWDHFKSRTLATVRETANKLENNDSALLVSSGGVISAIVLQLLNCPNSELFRINRQVHNASITVLSARKDKLSLHSFNNYSHLEAKGEQQLLTRI